MNPAVIYSPLPRRTVMTIHIADGTDTRFLSFGISFGDERTCKDQHCAVASRQIVCDELFQIAPLIPVYVRPLGNDICHVESFALCFWSVCATYGIVWSHMPAVVPAPRVVRVLWRIYAVIGYELRRAFCRVISKGIFCNIRHPYRNAIFFGETADVSDIFEQFPYVRAVRI